MNRSELIKEISQDVGLAKSDIGHVLDAAIDAITKTLSDGGNVRLTGFGNFIVRDRAARIGRNPQTGDEIQIAASKVAVFKVGKILKDAVRLEKF